MAAKRIEPIKKQAIAVEQESEEVYSVLYAFAKATETVGKRISQVWEDSSEGLERMQNGTEALTDAIKKLSKQMEDLTAPKEAPGALEKVWEGIKNLRTGLGALSSVEGFSKSFNEEYIKYIASSGPKNPLQIVFPNLAATFKTVSDKIKMTKLGKQFGEMAQIVKVSIGTLSSEVIAKITAIPQTLSNAFTSISGIFNGMSAGWVVLVGVIIAAIVALIVYWDEIVVWCTKTLPAAWNSFVADCPEWVRAIIDILKGMFSSVGTMIQAIMSNIHQFVEGLQETIRGVSDFIGGVFSGNLELALNGVMQIISGALNALVSLVKMPINRIIGLINTFLAYIVGKINSLLQPLGGIAGAMDFQLPVLTAPQIPYLAKGAVLPANKPFLAMVGDQKHGTNVEAPLSTIQEAVALVMEEHTAANLAGQEAIVAVLRQILTAVLGIELGDDVLGQAVQRYERKMAVVRGGY